MIKFLLKLKQIINYWIESILDFLHHILEYIFSDDCICDLDTCWGGFTSNSIRL